MSECHKFVPNGYHAFLNGYAEFGPHAEVNCYKLPWGECTCAIFADEPFKNWSDLHETKWRQWNKYCEEQRKKYWRSVKAQIAAAPTP